MNDRVYKAGPKLYPSLLISRKIMEVEINCLAKGEKYVPVVGLRSPAIVESLVSRNSSVEKETAEVISRRSSK